MNFLIYHAGFKGGSAIREAIQGDFKKKVNVPWVSDLCEYRRKNPKMTNVYMDLGTTFAISIINAPRLCAYMLGEMIQAFGEDHVLWGNGLDLVGKSAMANRSVQTSANAERFY